MVAQAVIKVLSGYFVPVLCFLCGVHLRFGYYITIDPLVLCYYRSTRQETALSVFLKSYFGEKKLNLMGPGIDMLHMLHLCCV